MVSWTNPFQLLHAHSRLWADSTLVVPLPVGSRWRSPQQPPIWVALKMKGLMKLYLTKFDLSSSIWPLPLLFQLFVISHWHWQTGSNFKDFGLFHLPRQDFHAVQLYKVPECDACAKSFCHRGLSRSAANTLQEFQLLASPDKCPTAGQRKGIKSIPLCWCFLMLL